jgi:transcriptional regulator
LILRASQVRPAAFPRPCNLPNPTLVIYLEVLWERHPFSPDERAAMPHPKADLLKGTLNLLILKALTFGPRHGYGIARWLEESSRSLLRIEEGSLYPALSRMEKRGWIRSEWGSSETNRKARYYRLTPGGRRQLEAQADGWDRLVEAMYLVLQRHSAGG